ncbi:MAG: SpoIIE family protein phosphatase, partial [Casimicrobiaceae bacterium]
ARSLTLQPGDGLFVYSDGITEAANTEGVQFGETRLVAALSDLARVHGRSLLDTVRDNVRAHCGTAPQTDDIAALLLRWTPR